MKTNFSSKLFDKKIDLESCNSVMGGRMASGCQTITFSGPTGATNATDSTTTDYDDNGNITTIKHCEY
ncbi:hypothetical protein [Psychroserpens algicola]|uniref:hypothetical protein n=1 Tax=Psychroserpens algicola TaxID=1719034 RepID=UPI001952C667|nr:hypothetical protein [Psychroserpens algicola]